MSRRLVTRSLVSTLWLLSVALAVRADDITDMKAKIAAAGDAAKYNADVVVVLDETVVVVQPDGVGEATARRVVKVLRDGGIRNQSAHRFDFDPYANRMEIVAVRVYRADGNVEEVPVTSAVLQPSPQWALYWGGLQFVIVVPRLSVGDGVELVTVKTGFNMAYLADETEGRAVAGASVLEPPMPGHWFDEVNFWTDVPIIEKRYVVRVPKDKLLQYEIYNGELRTAVTFDGDQVVYVFEKKDIPVYQGEAWSLSPRDTQCKLVLATVPDWATKGRWFHEKNEASFRLTQEIRDKVQEVTAGLKTDEEKITALNHWVAENIRYSGTTRGACEGYTTHPAWETLRDRCGVCKDKAGMLVAMLRAAGFESYIVITQAGTKVAPIPADQFNHAVTCIRQKDGTLRLLDPTWMPKSRSNWSTAEPLQNVLYGTPEGVDLSLSPYFAPEENLAAWKAETVLSASGELRGKLSFTATGRPEDSLRRTMGGHHPAERGNLFDTAFARLSPNTTVTRVRAMDPVDFSGSVSVELEFATPNYTLGSEERRYLRLPVLQQVLGDTVLPEIEGSAKLKERKLAVRLRATRRIVLEETLRLPEGWTIVKHPEPKTVEGPVATLKFEIEKSAGELRYVCEVEVKQHEITVSDYAKYKEVIDALSDLGSQYVTCEVETKSARRS